MGMNWELLHGDCLEKLQGLPDNSVDAVVTDPPYGLSDISPEKVTEIMLKWASGEDDFLPAGRGFNNQSWDVFVPPPAVWKQCFRVLKPGGHLVAFSGTRTHDLMTLSIRIAGFEIRDRIYDFSGAAVPAPAGWVYHSGMPKGQDTGKAVESTVLSGSSHSTALKATELAGDGEEYTSTYRNNGVLGETVTATRKTWVPSTEEGKQWDGWSTALKPAVEPITLARKPLGESTVAKNVMKWSTGALNIDATRVPCPEGEAVPTPASDTSGGDMGTRDTPCPSSSQKNGRFPSNIVFDQGAMDHMVEHNPAAHKMFHTFQYSNKASAAERPVITSSDGAVVKHPTVKPLSIMEWLVDLVCPPGGTVLDPFAGSGTTLQASVQCGFTVVGIERDADYCRLIQTRMDSATEGRTRQVATAPDDDVNMMDHDAGTLF